MTFGVAAYSFPCSCGFAQRNGRPVVTRPIQAGDLINLASEHALGSIEIPLQGMLPDRGSSLWTKDSGTRRSWSEMQYRPMRC